MWNFKCVKRFFLWPAGVDHYNEIKDISICEFWAPHLVIYVDSPAEEVQKKLKATGKVCMMNTTYSPKRAEQKCH